MSVADIEKNELFSRKIWGSLILTFPLTLLPSIGLSSQDRSCAGIHKMEKILKKNPTEKQADRVYETAGTEAMKKIAEGPPEDWVADRNIYEWYSQSLRDRNGLATLVDWGAGVGRFVPLFRSRGVKRFILIEPSQESVEVLRTNFAKAKDISIIKGDLDSKLSNSEREGPTIHVCNFVFNVTGNISQAFELLSHSIAPAESLFLVTNVFAPSSIVDRIIDSRVENSLSINMSHLMTPLGRLPKEQVFRNQILSNGAILNDSVHTVEEYANIFESQSSKWKIVQSKLLRPDGFEHIITASEDFGDYKFAVLVIEALKSR